jgi:hypothetical protein
MQKIAYHIQCFNRSRVDRIIITKTDESIGLGHLYSPVVSAKIPISYINYWTKGARGYKAGIIANSVRDFIEWIWQLIVQPQRHQDTKERKFI